MIDIISSKILFEIYKESNIKLIEKFILPINGTLNEFDITTVNRIAAFLAQIGHESGQLHYVEEIASGKAYDNRADLGNTKLEAINIAKRHYSSPGRFWKGRGLIQITGYSNYELLSSYFRTDFINEPEKLKNPAFAARSAGWFWKWKNLNSLADDKKFEAITKKINGGLNGQEDRLKLYNRALKTLTENQVII
jgi:putative chitinase